MGKMNKKGIEQWATILIILVLGTIFFILAYSMFQTGGTSLGASLNKYVLSKANIEPIKNFLFPTLKTLTPVSPEITFVPSEFCVGREMLLTAENSKYGTKTLGEAIADVCPEYGPCTYWKICSLSENTQVDCETNQSSGLSIYYTFSGNKYDNNYSIELTVRTSEGKNYTKVAEKSIMSESNCIDVPPLTHPSSKISISMPNNPKALNLWVNTSEIMFNISLSYPNQGDIKVSKNATAYRPVEFDQSELSKLNDAFGKNVYVEFYNISNPSQSISVDNISGYWVCSDVCSYS